MGHTLVTFGWRKTNQPNYQSTQFSVLGNLQEGLLWPIHTFLHQSLKRYVMRERPQTRHKPVMDELEKTGVKLINDKLYNDIVLNVQICVVTLTLPAGTEADGGLLGLPETENELDNLTEFNTAQNRRISMMGIPKEETFIKKRRKIHITFNDEEDVINPWDVDPSIGRFTNLVQSTVIPKANKQQTQVNTNQYQFH